MQILASPDGPPRPDVEVVVATFAEVLRDSPFADDIDLDDLEDEADNIADRLDIRAVEEFADLVSLADRFS